MTDHAGPLRSECPPGTKLWRPPAFVTQFWHLRSGFGARFRFARPTKLNSSEGKKYETKGVGNGSTYCFVSYFSPSEGCFLVLQKRKWTPKPLLGRQNCVTKGHNLVPGGLSLRASGASMVCQTLTFYLY